MDALVADDLVLPGCVLGHLARVLQQFQPRYPQIVLDMSVNDAAIDPVKEGFDCALQIFPPRSEELISRRLFPVRRIFCASPTYLRRAGVPREPADLLRHRLGWYSGYPTRERVAFHRLGAEGEPVSMRLTRSATVVSAESSGPSTSNATRAYPA